MQMSRLNEEELLEMVKNLLINQYNRSITLDQQASIRESLKQCPYPFYASLLVHEAAKWPSWLDIRSVGGVPVGNALVYLEKKFIDMENVHGQDICSAVFSFLECANQGLTDTELLDLCSYHSGLTRKYMTIQTADADNLCRMTYITWLQIKNDMTIYSEMANAVTNEKSRSNLTHGVIMERRLDNKVVATWSCPLIRYVVRGKFLASNQLLKQCHSDMADLFDDAWTYNQPPKRFKFISRLPTPQPLYSIQQSNGITHYNKRRVNNLWYHLLHSGSIDYFEERSLLNYEYLEAILYSSGLVKLLSIIEDASLQIINHNLYTLYSHCVKPALFSISVSPNLFVTELIGRLRYTRAKNTEALNHLVDQAMQWIDTNCVLPSLVPLTCWIKPPSTHLVVSFSLNEWPKESKSLVKATINYQYVFVCGSHSPDIHMFHVASNTLVRIFKGHTGIITVLECSTNGQFFLSSSMPENSIRVWTIMKGECTRTIIAHDAKIICLRISRDDRCLISGSADSKVKVIDIETGRVIRTLCPESGAVMALALTTHEEYLITGHSDFTVKLWHVDTGRMISKLGSLIAPVTLMALTSNDAFLLVASDDETLHVFSLCSGTELHELRGHEGKNRQGNHYQLQVASLAIASDDCQTFIGSTDGKIYRYDLHTGKILSIQGCSNVPVSTLEYKEGPLGKTIRKSAR
uniref:NWD1/2-like winged helix-turn-helix domain-containing protein n=1 Tax=Romanomermis culicivorax TaxID=13658 RepID=A0A915HV70_ROMCU